MNYHTREGVVLVHVCDTYLLIPTRLASETCHGIATISGIDAIVWKQLEKGRQYDEILILLSKFFLNRQDMVKERLDSSLKKMEGWGYIVSSEEQE